MKTKKYNFDTQVLIVLEEMEFKDVAGVTHGFITTTLDRDAYVRVNKALEALGGKWDRKAKAHIFRGDPRDELHSLLDADGELEQVDYEFFATPRAIANQMIELSGVKRFDIVLEPSAGYGAIALALCEHNEALNMVVNDLNEQCFNALVLAGYDTYFGWPVDFLSLDHRFDNDFDIVLQNPPFSKDIEHVYKAYDVLCNGGTLVSVVSEGPFFRFHKRDAAFREWLGNRNADIFHLPRGAFRNSGTDVKARLILVHKNS